MAQALGERVAIVTRASAEAEVAERLIGIQALVLPASTMTTFENREQPSGARTQRIMARAEPIGHEDIPKAWLEVPMVHLAPVAQEIAPDLIDLFPNAMIGVTPQGWLRSWDEAGLVSPSAWGDAERVLQRADAVVLSEWDIAADQDVIGRYAGLARLLVVTRGARGATLFLDGIAHPIPAPSANVIDPTGAGDVWAAAFFVWLRRTDDPIEAALFATCAASIFGERPSLEGIPTLAEIHERRHHWRVNGVQP
ncbi:MAG: ribokinase [Chloroflexi bacterium]|nr:ribokinase [Chloroflexota bacterium]